MEGIRQAAGLRPQSNKSGYMDAQIQPGRTAADPERPAGRHEPRRAEALPAERKSGHRQKHHYDSHEPARHNRLLAGKRPQRRQLSGTGQHGYMVRPELVGLAGHPVPCQNLPSRFRRQRGILILLIR